MEHTGLICSAHVNAATGNAQGLASPSTQQASVDAVNAAAEHTSVWQVLACQAASCTAVCGELQHPQQPSCSSCSWPLAPLLGCKQGAARHGRLARLAGAPQPPQPLGAVSRRPPVVVVAGGVCVRLVLKERQRCLDLLHSEAPGRQPRRYLWGLRRATSWLSARAPPCRRAPSPSAGVQVCCAPANSASPCNQACGQPLWCRLARLKAPLQKRPTSLMWTPFSPAAGSEMIWYTALAQGSMPPGPAGACATPPP